ncbi:hypothetical protein CQZ93_23775 [Ochrobactrum vermis]|nr:hypothetical protein CQZ93_23775 [Ochrobactrum vermis]
MSLFRTIADKQILPSKQIPIFKLDGNRSKHRQRCPVCLLLSQPWLLFLVLLFRQLQCWRSKCQAKAGLADNMQSVSLGREAPALLPSPIQVAVAVAVAEAEKTRPLLLRALADVAVVVQRLGAAEQVAAGTSVVTTAPKELTV